MTLRQFIRGLALTIITSVLLAYGFEVLYSVWMDWTFATLCLIFFVFLSITMFIYAVRSASDQNPYKFSRYFLLFSFLKIMGSLLLILIYFKIVEPPEKNILIYFLVVYILFTIFETAVYTRLSKSNRTTS